MLKRLLNKIKAIDHKPTPCTYPTLSLYEQIADLQENLYIVIEENKDHKRKLLKGHCSKCSVPSKVFCAVCDYYHLYGEDSLK